MNACLDKEKTRISRKEDELRDKILGINKELEQPDKLIPVMQVEKVNENTKDEKPINA